MMTRTRPVALTALVALALALAGCEEERACTLIGCAPSSLTLDTAGWEPGEYEIEVRYTAGGEIAFECTLELGQQVVADAGPIQSTCRQTAGDTRALELYPTTNTAPRLEVYDSPDEVRLVLRSDGETLFDDTIALEHEVSYPNGPHCGGCRSAEMTLTLL